MSAYAEGVRRWPPVHRRHEAAVGRVLQSRVLVDGPETRAFEEEFATYLETRNAILVSNGTTALTAALLGLGIGAGDEVIVPALTFSGTVLPVLHAGARPVFADVDPRTFDVDPASVEERLTERTAAVVAVHLHGLPADLDALAALTEPRGIALVEDACQAPGATYRGRRVGAIADAGVFSFNQTKPLWAGEGGAVVTDDDEVADRIRILRLFGERPDEEPRTYLTTSVGFNWKATEMQAALAREALRDLDEANAAAAASARVLDEALGDERGGSRRLVPPYVPENVTHIYHKYRALLDEVEDTPDELVERLNRAGVPVCRWQVAPLSDHPVFRAEAAPCPVARHVLSRSIVVGTEEQPLAAAGGEIHAWAERVRGELWSA